METDGGLLEGKERKRERDKGGEAMPFDEDDEQLPFVAEGNGEGDDSLGRVSSRQVLGVKELSDQVPPHAHSAVGAAREQDRRLRRGDVDSAHEPERHRQSGEQPFVRRV